ncbi:DUF6387 family protein, partial [Escherichia coli]|uniref:DUF6387 family protein n=1 Tax=Escherichia coli TaxID=562 RepID=UPI003EDEE568
HYIRDFHLLQMAIFVHEVMELSDKVSCAGFKSQRPVGIFDLASGTDEEIAESLKAALPQWRKVKGIDENPLESVRFGYGT